MPIYTWEDTKTKKTIDILRDVENIDVMPLREEVVANLEAEKTREEASNPPPLTEKEYEVSNFRRLIGQSIKSVRSPGWGAKGYWIRHE